MNECPLCGNTLSHGWDVTDPWICSREAGGCGARVAGPRIVTSPPVTFCGSTLVDTAGNETTCTLVRGHDDLHEAELIRWGRRADGIPGVEWR